MQRAEKTPSDGPSQDKPPPPLAPVTGALVLHRPQPQPRRTEEPVRFTVRLPSVPIPRNLLRHDPSLDAPTGLARSTSLDLYSRDAAIVFALIQAGTMNLRDGVEALFDTLHELLASADVSVAPENRFVSQFMPQEGSFSPTGWVMSINQGRLKPEALLSLFDTLYHETRHAEQFFRVARYLAGHGLSARKIAEVADIPESIAEAAIRNPLRLPERGWTPETLQAVRWYHAVAGSGASHRHGVLTQRNPHDFPLVQLRMEFDNALKLHTLLHKRSQELLRQRASLKTDGEMLAAMDLDPALPEDAAALRQHRLSIARNTRDCREWQEASATNTGRLRALSQRLGDLVKRHNQYAEQSGDLYYQSYRDLPEEVDAWDVGGKAGALTGSLIGPVQAMLALFDPSNATGVGNNCLLDSLDQLRSNRRGTNLQTVATMRETLVEVFPHLEHRMLDIYGAEGSLLAQSLGIRIRVVQLAGGRLRAHNVLLGVDGPIVHVLHAGNHFTALFLKDGKTDQDVLRDLR